MKKNLHFFIISALLLCEASFTGGGMAFADANGTCGEGLTWTYTTSDRKLTISGSGAMSDYTTSNSQTTAPWSGQIGAIKSIEIGKDVTNIGAYAFYKCSNCTTLTTNYHTSKLTTIGAYAFYQCSSLKDAKLPALSSIGERAFEECTSLTDFYISPKATLTSYPSRLLWGCTALKNVNIPSSVTSLGNKALYNCSAIEYIYAHPLSAPSVGTSALYNVPSTAYIKVRTATAATNYKAATTWKDRSSKISRQTSGSWTMSTYHTGTMILDDRDDVNFIVYVSLKAKSDNKPTGSVTIPEGGTGWAAGGMWYDYVLKSKTIEANGYEDCTGITSVTIGSAFVSVGENAFKGCTSLATVTIGSNITTLPSTSFTSCPLTRVTWNPKNFSDFGSSSSSPFYSRRTSITSFSISSSIEHIPAYLCYGMTGLTGTKYFYSSLHSIGENAFYGCTGLTGLSFTNATNLETIGANAFYNCNKVTSSIALPASLTSMGQWAFQSCKSISGVTFAEGIQLTSLPNYAFDNCNKLAGTIKIPAGITSIGEYAFSNCSTVVAMDLSKATELTTIGQYAFYGMTGVTGELYIPSKVSSIGTYAFNNMSNLSCIVAMPTTPPTAASAYTFNSVNKSIPVYVKDETTKNKYIAADCTGWKDFINYKYETDPEKCGDDLYWQFRFSTNRVVFTGSGDMWDYNNSDNKAPWRVYNNYLKYADYANDMTSIGDYAFYQCSNYIPGSFSIKASITRIGQYAYYGCSGITAITFASGSNLTSLGQRAFYGCSGLKTVAFPEGLEVIPTYCFYNCTSLTNVSFPSTLTTIGNSTFQYCSALENIDLPASVTTLEGYAFANCSSISFIKSNNTTHPDALTSSFNSINKETTLVCVPEGSEEDYCNATGWSAFCGNIGQEIGGTTGEVNWKLNFETKQLTIYGEGAMAGYSMSGFLLAPWLAYSDDIHELIVEEGVTGIGAYALYHATNLEKVTLPSTITYVGDYSFSGATNIDTLICAASSVPEVKSHSTYQSGITYLSSAFADVPNNIVVTVPLSAIATYKTTAVVGNSASLTGWNYFTNYHATGTCGASGDNLIWDYADATHTLSITGEGNMADYANATAMPWNVVKTDISSVVFDEDITHIGKYAFAGCSAITSLNVLPSSLTSIGYHAFGNCTELTSITIPRYVTKIGDGIVINSSKLSTVVWDAENCTTVLKNDGSEIAMSSSWNPFYGTTPRNKITSFTFGENVSVIPNGLCANMNNENFKSITIPASVGSIGENAFDGCTGITSVTSNAVDAPTIASNSFPASVKSSAPLTLVSCESKADYLEDANWNFTTIYPNKVQFNLKGHGSQISSQCIAESEPVEEPSDPSADYYSFGGWFDNEDFEGEEFDFSSEISADLTLYAKWTENVFSFADTDTDNSNIDAAEGKKASSVTIGRTVWKDGYYNTLCLPFSLSANEIATSPLAGYKALKRLSTATVTGTGENRVLNIQLEPITAITAGEPFLISYEAGGNITNPVFNNVTVTAATPGSIHAGDVTCHGIYARTDLGDANTNLFLGTNNTLYWPQDAEHSTMNGLRAYFSIDSSGSAYAGMRVRLTDKPAETPTGIDHDAPSTEPQSTKILRDGVLLILRDGKTYSAQGVRIQ